MIWPSRGLVGQRTIKRRTGWRWVMAPSRQRGATLRGIEAMNLIPKGRARPRSLLVLELEAVLNSSFGTPALRLIPYTSILCHVNRKTFRAERAYSSDR